MAFLLRLVRRAVWEPYTRALASQPVATKCVTSGVLLGAGDVAAQTLVERKRVQEIEAARVARALAIGTLITGPMVTGWYGFLERAVVLQSPRAAAIAKTALDQTIFAPAIISTFFTLNTVMAGQPWSAAATMIRDKLWPTLLVNWSVWPLASMINFMFVPLHLRVLYVSTVALFWNTYLSLTANKK